MHSIHISIGCNYNIIVSQAFIAFFNIKCMLQEVELFIFIHYFFGKTITVERFTTQAKYSLGIHAAGLSDGATGTITLGNKYGGFFLFFYDEFFVLPCWFVVVMKFTIPEFFIMQVGFFGSFVGEFFNSGELFSFPLILFNALF